MAFAAVHSGAAKRPRVAVTIKPRKRRQVEDVGKSLNLFEYHHPLRARLRSLVNNPIFDRIILCVILLNCFTLAASDPKDPENNTTRNAVLNVIEQILSVIFIFEMLIKIVVMGFCVGKRTYLKSGWNVLDFIIVMVGIVSWFTTANLTAFRAFRVLRPLRAISRIRKLKVIIGAFLQSLPSLADASVLFLLLILLFGIIGINLWKGTFHLYCTDKVTMDVNEDRLCSLANETGYTCPYSHDCLTRLNSSQPFFTAPSLGKVNFDNIFFAGLTVLVAITMEGWTDVMYQVFDVSMRIWTIYWILLITLGAFFLTNLLIIIINAAFSKSREEERMLAEKERARQINFTATDSKAKDEEKEKLPTREPVGIRKPFFKLVEHSYFQNFVSLMIIVNTLFMCIEHADQPAWVSNLLDTMNVVFTLFFLAEMVLKLIGLGPKLYVSSGWNCFDGAIVLFSVVDLFVGSNAKISVLRAFRLMRIFRVLRMLKLLEDLRVIITTVIDSIQETSLLILLLMLVIFIYACLGMQLYGGKFDALPNGRPREHFDTFFAAFVTVFSILTGENWNSVMYNAMTAAGDVQCIFFITLFFISNYVVLNLFIAVLLQSFEEGDDGDDDEEESPIKKESMRKLLPPSRRGPQTVEMKEMESVRDQAIAPAPGDLALPVKAAETLGEPIYRQTSGIRERLGHVLQSQWFNMFLLALILISCVTLAIENPRDPPDLPVRRACDIINIILTVLFTMEAVMKIIVLGFYNSENYEAWLERQRHKGDSSAADLEAELGGGGAGEDGQGDAAAKKAQKEEEDEPILPYIRDPFNVVDGFIVLISLITFVPALDHLTLFRALRAIRPLRLMNKSKGMKAVFGALLSSAGQLFYTVLLGFVIWLIFGIIGIQFFKEQFGRCLSAGAFIDPSKLPELPLILNRTVCTTQNLVLTNFTLPGYTGAVTNYSLTVTNGTYTWAYPELTWFLPASNFDWIFQAMLTLLEVASLEGWLDVMHNAIDGTGSFLQPRPAEPNGAAIYFLIFIIVAAFFLLNLLVSVLLSNYYKVMRSKGSILKSKSQKEWLITFRAMSASQPIAPEDLEPPNPVRRLVYRVVTSPKFDLVMAAVIILNVCFMATEHYPQKQSYTNFLFVVNDVVFTAIYIVEAILKTVGLGPRVYLLNAWNKFDVIVVILSIVSLIISANTPATGESLSPGSAISAVRLFRVARVIRVLKTHKGLQALMGTLIASIPDFANVTGLIFLVFFVYAIMGTRVFYGIPEGDFINDYANFWSFQDALVTLFRMSTGENWQGLMADTLRDPCNPPQIPCDKNHCRKDMGECLTSKWLGPLYFITFTILAMFIFVNLFIAVIVENFENVTESFSSRVSQKDIAKFISTWLEHDPECTGKIPSSSISPLLFGVGAPLGLRPSDDPASDAYEDDEDSSQADRLFNPYNKLWLLKEIEYSDPYPISFQDALVAMIEDMMPAPIPPIILDRIQKQAPYILKRFQQQNSILGARPNGKARSDSKPARGRGETTNGLDKPLLES